MAAAEKGKGPAEEGDASPADGAAAAQQASAHAAWPLGSRACVQRRACGSGAGLLPWLPRLGVGQWVPDRLFFLPLWLL